MAQDRDKGFKKSRIERKPRRKAKTNVRKKVAISATGKFSEKKMGRHKQERKTCFYQLRPLRDH